MIKINLIEDINRPGERIKAKELTVEEQSTVIATVVTAEQVVYFQQGDESKYDSYLFENERLRQQYVNNLSQFIVNLQ